MAHRGKSKPKKSKSKRKRLYGAAAASHAKKQRKHRGSGKKKKSHGKHKRRRMVGKMPVGLYRHWLKTKAGQKHRQDYAASRIERKLARSKQRAAHSKRGATVVVVAPAAPPLSPYLAQKRAELEALRARRAGLNLPADIKPIVWGPGPGAMAAKRKHRRR